MSLKRGRKNRSGSHEGSSRRFTTRASISSGAHRGLRLESALARPKHLWTYGDDPALPELAAAYGSGLIQNHPFADGNKRVGLLAIRAFLFQNGYRFEPGEAVAVIRSLAAGEASEEELTAWIEEHTAPPP